MRLDTNSCGNTLNHHSPAYSCIFCGTQASLSHINVCIINLQFSSFTIFSLVHPYSTFAKFTISLTAVLSIKLPCIYTYSTYLHTNSNLQQNQWSEFHSIIYNLYKQFFTQIPQLYSSQQPHLRSNSIHTLNFYHHHAPHMKKLQNDNLHAKTGKQRWSTSVLTCKNLSL